MPPAAVIPADPDAWGRQRNLRRTPQWTSRRLMASAGQDSESPGVAANGGRGAGHRVRHGTQAAKGKIEVAKGKYAGSSAEHLWRRLDSMDFINRGMLFAATLLLCLFPFLIVANALAGRSAATALARHLGLDKQAAADVGGLFTSSTATSNAITGTAWVFFILGGIAAATAIQGLYEAGLRAGGPGAQGHAPPADLAGRAGGLLGLGRLGGPALRGAGGPVLLGVIGLVVLTGFWWFTMLVPAGRQGLLAGAVPGRRRHGRVLAGHGGRLLRHLLRHGHLLRQQVRADRGGLCPDVLADRHRGGDHLRRCGGRRLAGAGSVVPGCRQEIAAGPERAPRSGAAEPGHRRTL